MTPSKTQYFARLLPISHTIVTWMLESVGVNVSTLCSRTRKTAASTTNGDERSPSVEDLEELSSDASSNPNGAVTGARRRRARLINASCNAFFLRRGLDSNFHVNLHSPPPRDVRVRVNMHMQGIRALSEFTQL